MQYGLTRNLDNVFVLIAVGFFGFTVLKATFFTVEQRTAAIVQRFGKFLREAGPGIGIKIPWSSPKKVNSFFGELQYSLLLVVHQLIRPSY